MATYTVHNNRLPDPTFYVGDAGNVAGSGYTGPGFSGVTIRSVRPTQMSRTNSGRGVHRESGSHVWEISIKYTPMLRDQFDIVSAFLEKRNGRLNPFYVVLPQYNLPKDPVFASYVQLNALTSVGATAAGSDSILIQAGSVIAGIAKFNDYFTIEDPNNANHQKTYKVVGTDTNALYRADKTQPATNQLRLYISPPLTRSVATGSHIKFVSPRFRVVQKGDVIESELNNDGLYSFQLDLEEIQP
jgi:hypothetical protein